MFAVFSIFQSASLFVICELVEKALELNAGELGSSPNLLFPSCVP